jgi:hypothetical protein
LARAGLVPYIASWSGERPTSTPLVANGRRGIGYRRERPGDRDAHGVLWQRYVRAPGVGEPRFKKVHPHRQRHAMRRLLCQVCGGPADEDERGILWLIGEPERGWSGEELTGPPGPDRRVTAVLRYLEETAAAPDDRRDRTCRCSPAPHVRAASG